jgi:hypothetical protein
MSDPGAPWWADVQHLRPREDRASEPSPARFARDLAPAHRALEERESAVATLEHEVPEPVERARFEPRLAEPTERGRFHPRLAEPAERVRFDAPLADEDAAWLETLGTPGDGDGDGDTPPGRLWDAALEEAFARTPSWAEEDDARLLPKGAHRIENGRRTIEIRGQVDRIAGITAPAETGAATRTGRRRPHRRPAERLAGRPDRVAMWAFLLGILLILIAALSNPGEAGAATLVL